jgi:dolichol-phosphate mannosyltransferase
VQIAVVIPTYNEAGNIARMIEQVLARISEASDEQRVIVVDDNSPDGTGDIADRLAQNDPRINVIHRQTKDGLGRAYIAGFSQALADGADRLVQLDADFSHDPADITRLLDACQTADLAIGSRYTAGGSTSDWSRTRLLLSRCGSWSARLILGVPVADLSGGFKCWRAETLAPLLDRITATGFVFQAETTFLAHRAGARIVEVPIIFHERAIGESKMSPAIAFEGFWRVLMLRRIH